MMPPDKATRYSPDPDYLRMLIDRIGLSQREIARRLGINESQFRKYLTNSGRATHRKCPYVVQYALESWAVSADQDDPA